MSDDFKMIKVPNVKFVWPRLDQTYRYNERAGERGKSEPCPPTVTGAAYSIGMNMDKEKAKALFAECKDHFEKTSKETFSTVWGMTKEDDGTVTFRAKRNGTNSRGQINSPPLVIDGKKNPLKDVGIWNDSTGTVLCSALATKNAKTGAYGITLYLNVVQVTHAVYGSAGSNLDDLDEVDTTYAGGSAGSDLDYLDEVAPAAAKPASAGSGPDLSDEIPFAAEFRI